MSHTSRCKNLSIAVLVAVLSMSVCVLTTKAEVKKSESVKLKVVAVSHVSSAPFFIAQEEGYFAEQGLEIEFVRLERTAEALPLLMQGELDVMAGVITFGAFNTMAKESRFKIVADKGNSAPEGCTYLAFLARRTLVESGGLENLTQLRGKRIAMSPINADAYYLATLLKTAGLTMDDVEFHDLPYPVLGEALEKGTVDIVRTTEPWLTQIMQQGHAVLWKTAQQIVPDFQFSVVFYSSTLLTKNPDVGKKFMVAYLKAVRQYNQGKTARNLEILMKYTGLTQDLLQATCWIPLRPDGTIHLQSVFDFQRWGVERKLLDQIIPQDQFWDPRFIEHANKILETPEQ